MFIVVNVIYYAYACTCTPYDVIVSYVMFIRETLKGNHFRNICFQTHLKLKLCMLTFFIIKPEVVGTITMTTNCLFIVLLRNFVFLTPMFLCHLQRMTLGSMVIYVEFPV